MASLHLMPPFSLWTPKFLKWPTSENPALAKSNLVPMIKDELNSDWFFYRKIMNQRKEKDLSELINW